MEVRESAEMGIELEWDALITPHLEIGFRLAYLTLGSAAEAEDAVQDALLKAWRQFSKYDASRPFRPWWLQIVINTARNRRRSLARYWAALTRATGRATVVGPSAEQRHLERAGNQRLWEAVRKLTASDQSVLHMRFFLELNVEECAAVLGIAAGTVKSRTHRSLAKLKQVIREEFPDILEEWQDETN